MNNRKSEMVPIVSNEMDAWMVDQYETYKR